MTLEKDTPNAHDEGPALLWHKAVDVDELDEGQVKACPVGLKAVALTRLNGKFGAVDNRCPHQGGPLGQGTVENGKIRCPWHGFDFDPFTGAAAGGPDFDVRTPTRSMSGRTACTSEPQRRWTRHEPSVTFWSRR
ncbi:Rieske (2Fe-2S) protein [Mycolicibacter arupensis]|uniref:Rieske (2Fe-2S) protein n=1 Tax=Mycolicibacter arupensis TaxID=342002 RepID=UPI001F287037|nr:Rieske (2Fe-2S) protein [Mycolicibacter arupensis]